MQKLVKDDNSFNLSMFSFSEIERTHISNNIHGQYNYYKLTLIIKNTSQWFIDWRLGFYRQ